MRKTFLSLALVLIAAPAFSQPGNNGGGQGGCGVGQQTNGCGGVLTPPALGGVAGGFIVGGAFSGSLSGSFARNVQTGVGTGYAQTEAFGRGAAEIQAGTQLPFRVNGLASTGSFSQTGSSVVNGNGSVGNITGGFGLAGAGVGAVGGFGIR